jgi:hypothetical protein
MNHHQGAVEDNFEGAKFSQKNVMPEEEEANKI